MVVDVLANIPSPPQGVWYLGPLPLRGYALSILAAIIIGVLWTKRRYAARGGNPEIVLDVAIAAIPAGTADNFFKKLTIFRIFASDS